MGHKPHNRTLQLALPCAGLMRKTVRVGLGNTQVNKNPADCLSAGQNVESDRAATVLAEGNRLVPLRGQPVPTPQS